MTNYPPAVSKIEDAAWGALQCVSHALNSDGLSHSEVPSLDLHIGIARLGDASEVIKTAPIAVKARYEHARDLFAEAIAVLGRLSVSLTDLAEGCHEDYRAEERRLAYVDGARERWESDGEIEIDDGAVVSEGSDPGAYVQAWIWVSNNEAGVTTDDE